MERKIFKTEMREELEKCSMKIFHVFLACPNVNQC